MVRNCYRFLDRLHLCVVWWGGLRICLGLKLEYRTELVLRFGFLVRCMEG